MSAPVNTTGGDVEKAIGNPALGDDKIQVVSPVVADEGRNKKKQVRFAKFINPKTCFDIALTLLALLSLIAIVVMALQIRRDMDAIQKLNHELDGATLLKNTSRQLRAAGNTSYMDGFSGMIEEDLDIVERADMAAGVSSTATAIDNATSTTDTCDDETDVPEVTSVPFVNVTSSSIHVNATTSPVTTTTVLASLSATVTSSPSITSSTSVTVLVSAAAVSAVTSPATETTMVSSTTSQTCGEWGDGHGPCTRPYGAPNTPPGSATSTHQVMSVASAPGATIFMTPAGSLNTSLGSSGVISMTLVGSLNTSQGSTTMSKGSSMSMSMSMNPSMTMSMAMAPSATMTADAISASVPLSTSTSTTTGSSTSTSTGTSTFSGGCAPPTTVYVTISTSATVSVAPSVPAPSVTGNASTASHIGTTYLTTLTSTIPGTNGTEVVTTAWANTTTTTHKPTSTLTSFTVTFTTPVGGNNASASATTATSTGGDNNPPAGVTPIPVLSGGEKAVGKPVLGASGNTSGTGNGVYCLVMLVSLVALLV
ncbi:hypothetical protein SLS53_007553 [Cytospora paraplurivora]|uniref:Uncharacterized protein n=1 Tax=Cytospora paraplurivora TaxID=2898453 RepID=A0AAN9YDV7_9PEZI